MTTIGRASNMMILSALMKMLLWTLPSVTMRAAAMDSDASNEQRLRLDVHMLETHKTPSPIFGCARWDIEQDLRRVFLSDSVLRSLVVDQYPAVISSTLGVIENFAKDVQVDAENTIHGFLRMLMNGKDNEVLSEAAYVVPVGALPLSARHNQVDTNLRVYAAKRGPQSAARLERDKDNVTTTTSSRLPYDEKDPKYDTLTTAQRKLIEEANSYNKTEEPFTNKRPNAAIQKYCIDGGFIEWRLVLAFLVTQTTTKLDSTVPIFYVSMPLHKIDLNQCGDSPIVELRNTHGCLNSTCTFVPGGGFELGHYKCCCQPRNTSNGILAPTFVRLSDEAVVNGSQTAWATTGGGIGEDCFDGLLVERFRISKPDKRDEAAAYPGQCVTYFEGNYTMRKVLLAVNVICAMAAFALIFVVMTQRKVQDWGARGWALMELFLLGAILLYSIVILEFLQPQSSTCGLIVWCRELGFALFYGAVVLKIHRNLFEHRVRKAHHVYIKEKDLLKYLLCIVAFTVIGLVAWTVTAVQAAQPAKPTGGGGMGGTEMSAFSSPSSPTPALLSVGRTKEGRPYTVCTFFHWNIVWHSIEFAFLTYGAYLSYKARNTTWNERRQFAVAVFMEVVVSLVMIVVKSRFWLTADPDTLLLLSFIQVHLTITLVIGLIMATKFYYASLDPSARAHSIVSSGPNKPHPSLAKLRDNLVNGTVDFAEVPIAEMNPEDIRAELKRVYTQLRMYKLTNLYMENPHISKRKGGKKTSSKQTNRRFSIPTVPNKAHNKELKRLEPDERSSLAKGTDDDKDSMGSAADLTIQSSPHNIYLSRTALAAAKKLQLDSDLSVRI